MSERKRDGLRLAEGERVQVVSALPMRGRQDAECIGMFGCISQVSYSVERSQKVRVDLDARGGGADAQRWFWPDELAAANELPEWVRRAVRSRGKRAA